MFEVDLGKVVAKDYEDLSNKPKINGVEISGNLTTDDLNIDLGTEDYEELGNKPSINDVELSGNKTLEDLGIASKTALEETNIKVDTIIEKADLGIKETASGEEIHLTDSAEGKAVEFALFGKAKQNTTSGKNLLPYPYYETTHTQYDINWTDNGDGSVTANGTNTNTTTYSVFLCRFRSGDNNIFSLPKGTYFLSGCPSGGSNSTYNMYVGCDDGNGKYTLLATDNGNGAEFTLTEDTILQVQCNVHKNVTVSSLTFKPMIRFASTDDTWEQPTNGATPRPDYPQEIEVSGESYNLLENTATSKTVNGVVFTVNEDKSITVSGTASVQTHCSIYYGNEIPKGSYILSQGAETMQGVGVVVDALESQTVGVRRLATFYNGNIAEFKNDYSDYNFLNIYIVVDAGVAVSKTFYPMIRKASVKNDRYMPYGVGSVEVKSVGKNLLKNVATTKTVEGVTFTINKKDGSINANGTSTSASVSKLDIGTIELKAGVTYIISGCTGGADNKYRFSLLENNNLFAFVYGEEVSATPATDCTIKVRLDAFKDYTIDNIILYPMIRLASDTDNTYEPYKETISTIPTPNGLAGIKVSSGGNYTDSNGQQWICDEIVKYADGSGEYVQRVKKFVVNGTETWSGNTDRVYWTENVMQDAKMSVNPVICDSYIFDSKPISTMADKTIKQGVNTTSTKIYLYVRDTSFSTVDELKTEFAKNNISGYYILKEPITTPLTAEQLAEISTFYPVTTISNDADCGMKVKYNADSKNYIDNKLALQAKAREEEMMAMFLLLPEETQAKMIENDTNNLLTESEE